MRASPSIGHYDGEGAVIYKHACALGCEGIVSKRLGSTYRSGRVNDWLKIKNPAADRRDFYKVEKWSKDEQDPQRLPSTPLGWVETKVDTNGSSRCPNTPSRSRVRLR
jgi:bifunctional non-homologous end joining protein LigD